MIVPGTTVPVIVGGSINAGLLKISGPSLSVADALAVLFPTIVLPILAVELAPEMEETAIPPPLDAELLAMVAFVVVKFVVPSLENPKY